MNLDPSNDAVDFVLKLDAKRFRQVMRGVLAEPHPHDCRPLRGYADVRRIDVGECRICYQVSGDTVEALLIGPRNDDQVYREPRRRLS